MSKIIVPAKDRYEILIRIDDKAQARIEMKDLLFPQNVVPTKDAILGLLGIVAGMIQQSVNQPVYVPSVKPQSKPQ